MVRPIELIQHEILGLIIKYNIDNDPDFADSFIILHTNYPFDVFRAAHTLLLGKGYINCPCTLSQNKNTHNLSITPEGKAAYFGNEFVKKYEADQRFIEHQKSQTETPKKQLRIAKFALVISILALILGIVNIIMRLMN